MRNQKKMLAYCKHGIRNDQPCPICEQIESHKTTGKCTHGVETMHPHGCPKCMELRQNFPANRHPNPMPEREAKPGDYSLDDGPSLADVYAELQYLRKKFDEIAARQFADPTPDQEFLTVKQAAAYLNVSESSIRRMKHLHVKRGKSIRLRRSVLDRQFRPDPLKRKAA